MHMAAGRGELEDIDKGSQSSDSDSSDSEALTIAMIPIADALNASSGLNNARLFSMDEINRIEQAGNRASVPSYTMSAVTSIKAGTQIVSGSGSDILILVQYLQRAS